jgi:Domain of unknown function (DUF4265)
MSFHRSTDTDRRLASGDGQGTPSGDDRMTRVRFYLDPTDWHGAASERLWATPVDGANATTYELRNTPFYAKGISFLDWVDVTYDEESGNLDFRSVVRRSGHSTYRIIVSDEAAEAFDQRWTRLANLGCTFESGSRQGFTLYAIDLPETSDIRQVFECLRGGEEAGAWIFEEGHVGQQL